MRNVTVVGRILILCTALVACQRDDVSGPLIDGTGNPSLSRGSRPYRGHVVPLDQRLADLVADVPGFAGMYYDTDGELTVMLKDPRGLSVARSHIAAFMRRGKPQSPQLQERVARSVSRMRARKARHDFRDLNSWHRMFVAAKAHRISGTVLTAIDHRKNRIVVGVNSRERIAPMKHLLAQLPVPHDAVEVIEMGDIQPTNRRSPAKPFVDTTLQQAFSPVPGGVQVAFMQGGEPKGCTVGYNALRWLGTSTADTSRFFITASHCTPSQGQSDAGFNMFHPTLNATSSVEVVDPPSFTYSPSPPSNQCPEGRICFFADAVLMKWSVASSAQHGYVAATAVENITVNGRYTVVGVDDPYQGQVVHVTGAVIGRHYDEVIYPCATITYTGNLKTLICQGVAFYDVNHGDSGGPVYALHSGNAVTALGIHYAAGTLVLGGISVGPVSIFSPMSSVLNSIYDGSGQSYYMDVIAGSSSQPALPGVYNPPSGYASITGTSSAGFNMTCHFYSGTDIDNPVYEWQVNGNVVGSNPDLYYESGTSSYTLTLHVWSPTTGAHAWDTHEVTVSESTSQCWDQ